LQLPTLEAYNVHPLFIEDILNDAERSKVENLGANGLVILFQAVKLVEEELGDSDLEGLNVMKLEMDQVSLVLQDNTLLSFFNSPSKTVEICKSNIATPGTKLRTTDAHWLLHMIIDKEVDRLYPMMNRFRMQLDKVRDLLCTERPKTGGPNIAQQQYATIFRVIQTTLQEMNNLLFVLRPLASTVASLTEHARQRNMTELQWHYNDLRDHILTILDYVASLQASSRSLKDDYSYMQQDAMNRTMYLLTLITALFIPAQFLTGLFGMNFTHMPWLEWKYGYWAFWGVIAGINCFIVWMFRRIKWL
jgi:magnesium transporter